MVAPCRVHLCLYLPGLLERGSAAPPGTLRTLAHRIAQVEPAIEGDGAIASLAPCYGVTKQRDWPLAAVRAGAVGLETGKRYWLRATPVLLEASHDDVRVVGPVSDIDPGHASAFIATLSQHFAPDGVSFMLASTNDWLVATDRVPALVTRPLVTAIGARVRGHLATGDDSGLWRRWGQEIEMLLHDHPANGAREQQGCSIVNSVWWQHGGVYPQPAGVSVRTWADDADLRALAQHVGAPAEPSARDVNAVLLNAGSANLVMSTDPGFDLQAIEDRFITPILRAVDEGRVHMLDVIADAPGKPAVRWRVERRPWWARVLRKRQPPLSEVIARVEDAVARAAA